MTDRSLSELVQQAEQLSTHMDEGGEELPRVDRSLMQIFHIAQNVFAPTVTAPSGNHDAQASILLGSRGVDLFHMSQHLEALNSARTLEPLSPAPDTDIAAFLRNERHSAIISAIEDTRRQTHSEVEHLFWEQQKSDWEQAKQKFMSAFTNVNAGNLNITSQPQESLLSSLSFSSKGSSLNLEEINYAKVITDYNTEVLHGGIRPNLAENLYRAAASLDDQSIADLWSLVCCIAEVPISIGNDPKDRYSQRVQTALVRQSRRHLEKSYENHMRKLVYSQLERANLGGVPGLVPLVKAYLGVVLPPQSQAHLEDGLAKGVPIWPLIYYCLRAGGPKAAAVAAQENSNPSVAEVIPALEHLEKSESGRISSELEKKLRLSYKRSNKNITDPFKRVVYSILSHYDVDDDHADIIVTTDDYLWLKLSLALHEHSKYCKIKSHESPHLHCHVCSDVLQYPFMEGVVIQVKVDCEVAASSASGTSCNKSKMDSLSLSQLQNLLYVQYGEKHFNAFQQPLLYTSVLLLTSQFEAACEFLSRIESLRCHAVHIALALQEMNLLALSTQSSAPLLCTEEGDPSGLHRLNLVQLIRLYIRKFEITNPLEALHYCFFFRNIKSKSQSMFNECISELVLQSREFDMLLGTLNIDGSRTPGIVDKFKVDICEIAEVVAQDSEKKGLHEDAIKLYDLAKNHEKTLQLLNQLLSQVVYVKGPIDKISTHGSKRGRVMEMASAIALRFRTHGTTASPPAIATLHLLLDAATFFDLFHQERFSEAIEVLKRLKVIALTRDEVDNRVTGVNSLGIELKSVLPHMLLAAMTSTYRLYQSPAPSSPGSQSSLFGSPLGRSGLSILNMSAQVLPATKHLKEQARAIVTFAGMIPLRLNADVNARLVQLEALIN